jgi:DNA-binding winged helix-turn-helix (wHTH) protein
LFILAGSEYLAMKEVPFIINNRFLVDPTLNYFKDRETNQELRLEPRLMDVLCFLAANENQLVTREKLIKEIWNDYGGADEGLNQAVSFLRKLLVDREKKIIETIPKKGYILHAFITKEVEEVTVPLNQKATVSENSKKNIYWIVSLFFVILISLVLIYINSSRNETNGPDMIPTRQTNANPDILQDTNNVISPDKKLDSVISSTDSVGADVIKR